MSTLLKKNPDQLLMFQFEQYKQLSDPELKKWWNGKSTSGQALQFKIGIFGWMLSQNKSVKGLDFLNMKGYTNLGLLLNAAEKWAHDQLKELLKQTIERGACTPYQDTHLEMWSWLFKAYDTLSPDFKSLLQTEFRKLPVTLYTSSPTRIHALENLTKEDIPLLVAAMSNSQRKEIHKELQSSFKDFNEKCKVLVDLGAPSKEMMLSIKIQIQEHFGIKQPEVEQLADFSYQ